MRAGIAACQPKKWLDLFAFHLAPLLPVQMHCGLTDPPNAVVESRSTPTIAVNHRKPSLWGWLSSSEPLDFWSLLGSCTALDGQLEQFLNLILAKDWSGSQANDWHLMPARSCQQVLRCFDVSQEPALRQSARQLRDHELFGRNSLPVPSCSQGHGVAKRYRRRFLGGLTNGLG